MTLLSHIARATQTLRRRRLCRAVAAGLVATGLASGLAGCADHFAAPVSTPAHRIVTDGDFALPSGVRLPYRDWLPPAAPAGHEADDKQPVRNVVLALHGFNDSRNAWRTIGPVLARGGIAVFAPDLPDFGATAGRGYWPGSAELVATARVLVATLHRRYPMARITVMGESMGGAVGLMLGAAGDPLVSSYVLISPAVWGGKALAPWLRFAAAASGRLAPWLRLTGQQMKVRASDDLKALRRLSEDPLTIHATRLGTVAGLVRLMGGAQRACARFAPRRALILYGGHDQLVPKAAMADCWQSLPRQGHTKLAYYPPDYHLMLLDRQRSAPINDIVAFILHPDRPLPSAAATNATIFLAEH